MRYIPNSRKRNIRILLPVVILAIFIAFIGQANSQTQNCEAQSSWFPHSQTPRPNDAAFRSISNCVFHQWSWQMFLWLTQEWNGQPRFLSFESPQSLIGLEGRGMMPRRTKHGNPLSFDEFLQAGTDGLLIDHNGKAVYYSQYVNPTFADFIKGINADGKYSPSDDYTKPLNVQAMGRDAPNTDFPIYGNAGALELKASWRVLAEGENPTNIFVMNAELNKLVNTPNGIQVSLSETYSARVALVGFHIGGIVKGHPEMIWATFEHNENAPDVPPNTKMDEPVSSKNYTFYTANTALKDCNINPAKDGLVLDEATQTFTPITQVCRRYPFGNAPNVNQGNTDNIQSLNESVQGSLGSSDLWVNYDEIGAIWFNKENNLSPGLSLSNNDLLTGSLSLSNSTIETFTQHASVMNNCFRCHNTEQEFPPKMSLDPLPATNLNISHAFQNIYFWSQEIDAIQAYLKNTGEKQ